jgi:hypothetical protein
VNIYWSDKKNAHTWQGDEPVALQGHEEHVAHEVAGGLTHAVARRGVTHVVLHREKTAFNRERNRIHKKKIQSVLWILNPGVSDPCSFDGSGSRVVVTKSKKKFTGEIFFGIKNYNLPYLFLGLHKGCPSYRSPQKRTSITSKHEILNFFNFCG